MTVRSETRAECPVCHASIQSVKYQVSTGCGHATLIAGPGATKSYTQGPAERVVIQ